ncbi:alpha/beta fold hydrolase [Solimonas terrae]|uniref:Alpha/beta hydrolase n=1 Tax=Solimonas terrae TaxID=1396819 RepID=A0A6M2BNU7_9GAMM|nr:alpha/beta hydrolase [Solimonas terrae]NGY04044.1 alpha/beta hydrolase [Solimonas terrae]
MKMPRLLMSALRERSAARSMPDREASFEHGGYRLAYEVYGPDEGEPIILVHGILLNTHCNRDVATWLAAEGYRVILLDLLGHGRSDKPTRAAEHRVDFYAEQLLGLMDHLGIERAILGGLSLGAVTTLTAACIAPHRVRALLLEMPVAESGVPAAALFLVPLMLTTHYARPVWRLLTRFMRWLPESPYPLLNSAIVAGRSDPEVIRAVLHGVLVGPIVPSQRRRRHVQQPTLVIGHAGDPLHALADARALRRHMPNAEVLVARSLIELRTRPERLRPDILAFLHRVRSDGIGCRLPAAAAANG